MMRRLHTACFVSSLFFCSLQAHAQASAAAHITLDQPAHHHDHLPAAALWLSPVNAPASAPWPGNGQYVLLQKNRMFSPHVLIVPIGAVVSFPNADPFFHNVFSLFEGKRFDLGLYEKGSSKTVQFNRPGVSYLFCNIHPTMSAVVIAVNTPFWSIATADGEMRIEDLEPGEYDAHLWVEGESQDKLDKWTHRVVLQKGSNDVGEFQVVHAAASPSHTNKFGQPYPHDASNY
jgi:plastocyanin